MRRVTGGLGIRADRRVLAVADCEGTLPLTAEGAFAEDLQAMGARPIADRRRDGTAARMGCTTLPDAALDDPALACDLG